MPCEVDAYGLDRVFPYLRHSGGLEPERLAAELPAHGYQTETIYARGVEHFGRLFFMLESASAVVGCALQHNPSDQPQLQQSEDNVARALEQSVTADSDLSVLHADGLKVAHGRLSTDDPAGAIDQLVATLGKGNG